MRSRDTRERVDAYLDFRAALRDALAQADPKQFRLFLRDAGEDLEDPELRAMGRWSDEALMPLMCRMTIADAKLAEHHPQARAWLREHHMAARVRPAGYGWSTELRQRYRKREPERQARSA